MRSRVGLCLAFVALAVAAEDLDVLLAQSSGACSVQLDRVGREGRIIDLGPGRIRRYLGGGVWAHCVGQVTSMRSDSVASYSELARFDMIGQVHFRDSTVALDADRATYFLVEERLEAYDDVRLVNLETGSVLTGPSLTYYRAVAGKRETSELYATGRPTVEYRSRDGDEGSDPYVIVGDRLRLKGNNNAWAGGSVTIDRADFTGRSDSASLDMAQDGGALFGNAWVASRDTSSYELSGRRILFRLEDDQLSWVQARGLANARSEEWELVADTIEFHVEDDRIQSGIAWGDSTRSTAVSESYTIIADSIAIDTPDQRLRELRAFRNAVATARVDSAESEPDWIAGDTVVARFDTTDAGERILSVLDAYGNALAFYHIPDEDGSGLPRINYSRGQRIIARFGKDGVEHVDVLGDADGIYLEPRGGRR